MVIRPWGMAIWDEIHRLLDERIKEDTGTSNAYFPLLIPQSFLAQEAQHISGFAKECAVVTHHRLITTTATTPSDTSSSSGATTSATTLMPDPDAILEEPLIIRPTSETIIWHSFQKWIQSYRDLPLKINQWANVLRWEMRTRPFLRTSEFLWQEGHTAHASNKEAQEFAEEILSLYANFCHEILALPVIPGVKSPSERFAGAEATYTIESMMQNGWALQTGTSHFLGENFAKAFEVTFQNEKGEKQLVSATSWGMSTRLIGGVIMTHSDDLGLVLPPRIAPLHLVIVPYLLGKEEKDQKILESCNALLDRLKAKGSSNPTGMKLRMHLDARKHLRPGVKYYEWEMKGVPLRLDIGLREIEKNQISITIRHSGEKKTFPLDAENLSSLLHEELSLIQEQLFQKAQERLTHRTYPVNSYAEMKRLMEDPSHPLGFYLVPWKDNAENEEAIKKDCKATIRCFPFAENHIPPAEGVKCFYSQEQATHYAIFARVF